MGVIKSGSNLGVRFSYIKHEVDQALTEGFLPYVEFPDVNAEYSEKVLDIFGQRLMKSARADKSDFYSFWEIKPELVDNKYYMLAHTQGMVTTDNFEFLSEYYPVRGMSFVSDLAGLSYLNLDSSLVSIGDKLRYEKEFSNQYDKKAIKVFKGDLHIGYVKPIHNRVFHKGSKRLNLEVKALDKNGIIKKIFIKITR